MFNKIRPLIFKFSPEVRKKKETQKKNLNEGTKMKKQNQRDLDKGGKDI